MRRSKSTSVFGSSEPSKEPDEQYIEDLVHKIVNYVSFHTVSEKHMKEIESIEEKQRAIWEAEAKEW
jgi:hypothetical protein